MPTRHLAAPQTSYANRLIVLGIIIITAGFCAVFAAGLWESRDRDRERARLAASNVIASVSSEIERNLERYGLSLEAVVDGLKLPDIATIRPELRQHVLFDRAATAKDMGSIFVLDHEGTLIYDSRILAPMPEGHAGRDYFVVHRQNPRAGLYVSMPWHTINGHYIAISRVLTDASGAFAGAVVGTMRLSYFETIFRELNLGARDTITLVRENGTMIMRAPLERDMIGRNLASSPVFARIVAHPSGSFEEIGRIDGVERLFVFKRVADYPLIVSYNLAIADIYAGWWRKVWQFGSLILALCAINLMLVVFLIRALKQRGEAQQQLAAMATTDGLTGLCNRRTLDSAFESEWKRAQRAAAPLALLMIDADSFKNYNDLFGHQTGDTALIAIAHCIQDSAQRATDICARYGGEEFAVLLPGLSTAEAAEHAETIRASVLTLRAQQQGRPDSTPTISIGVASMIPRVGLEPRDLIKAADAALYDAKRRGRNRTASTHRLPVIVAA
jgi:diguanylate cyclase (GGDEF)-like protein